MCLKTISVFNSFMRSQYHIINSKFILFIPQIINDSERSNYYVNNKSSHIPLFLKYRHKISLNKLVLLIYKQQERISWVDFRLCYSGTDCLIFIAELVYFNKEDDNINYHLCWPDSLITNGDQHIPLALRLRLYLTKLFQ